MCYNLLQSFHDSGERMLRALQLKGRSMDRGGADQKESSYRT